MISITLPSLDELPKTEIRNVPEISGVYFLFNSETELIYIGESYNIKKRMDGHKYGTKWFHEVKYVSILSEITIKIDRSCAEYIFKHIYNPIYNHVQWQCKQKPLMSWDNVNKGLIPFAEMLEHVKKFHPAFTEKW